MDLRIDSEWLERRGKPAGIAVAVLAGALLMLDTVVLRGDRVHSESISLRGGDAMVFTVTQPGERHLVEIGTSRGTYKKKRGRALEILLEDPEGDMVWEDSEIISHKRRSFSFTPIDAGDYVLKLDDNTLLAGSSGTARVAVYVNDHRLLRWLPSF